MLIALNGGSCAFAYEPFSLGQNGSRSTGCILIAAIHRSRGVMTESFIAMSSPSTDTCTE